MTQKFMSKNGGGKHSSPPFTINIGKNNTTFRATIRVIVILCLLSLFFILVVVSGGFNMYSGLDCRPENLINRTVATDYNKCVTDENGMSSRSFCTSDGSQLTLGAGEWFTTQ